MKFNNLSEINDELDKAYNDLFELEYLADDPGSEAAFLDRQQEIADLQHYINYLEGIASPDDQIE